MQLVLCKHNRHFAQQNFRAAKTDICTSFVDYRTRRYALVRKIPEAGSLVLNSLILDRPQLSETSQTALSCFNAFQEGNKHEVTFA